MGEYGIRPFFDVLFQYNPPILLSGIGALQSHLLAIRANREDSFKLFYMGGGFFEFRDFLLQSPFLTFKGYHHAIKSLGEIPHKIDALAVVPFCDLPCLPCQVQEPGM